MQHLKVRRELEFCNFKFYKESGGEGGTGKVREEENKQKIFWRFTLFGGIPQREVAKSAIHSSFKCITLKIFTSHTLIVTFHLFRFESDETVTLAFNLT